MKRGHCDQYLNKRPQFYLKVVHTYFCLTSWFTDKRITHINQGNLPLPDFFLDHGKNSGLDHSHVNDYSQARFFFLNPLPDLSSVFEDQSQLTLERCQNNMYKELLLFYANHPCLFFKIRTCLFCSCSQKNSCTKPIIEGHMYGVLATFALRFSPGILI